ncbi:MAG: DUF3667 domain-containing protein [Flammeovirgaceae bacterium]|jgi:hypothetical protein|nr:DUF3667 domain-containing protein [Flammeovirgaceae bacterium]
MSERSLPEQDCRSCGNHFVGFYCNVCGEKVLLPEDKKLKSFLSTILVAVTFADSKFAKTLWLVIRKPGILSRDYSQGIRVKYVKPLQLFFILNLVYFLFPVFQLFNSSLYTQITMLPHSDLAKSLVAQELKASGISFKAYALLYDSKSQSLAKLLIVVFILFASVPLSVIFRKKRMFFSDHSALAVELAVFNLAINAIALSACMWCLNLLFTITESNWNIYLNEWLISMVFISTNIYFLAKAGRNFYNTRGLNLSVQTIAGLAGLYLSLEVYRLFLFLVTFYTL